MRTVKAIFFSAFLAFLGTAAYAQSVVKEEASANGGVLSYDLTKTVTVFPNPAVEFLHVKFEEPVAKKSKLTIHNIIGNVLDVESEMIDEHEIRLRVKDLPVGYYVLAVRDDEANARHTIKFLKR